MFLPKTNVTLNGLENFQCFNVLLAINIFKEPFFHKLRFSSICPLAEHMSNLSENVKAIMATTVL